MRIIAGKHKSRVLNTLSGMNTRPMTDRMKESIFNTIGPYFNGGKVLDLFGGSGALSLEAISRGMEEAFICDNSIDAVKVINSNIVMLKEEKNVHVLKSDYKNAIKRLSDTKFDLIFLDPPYKLNINNEIIYELIDKDMLNEECIIVCQYVRGNMNVVDNLTLLRNYSTGNSEVSIYQK